MSLSKIYQIGRNVRSNGSRTESASVKDLGPPIGEPRAPPSTNEERETEKWRSHQGIMRMCVAVAGIWRLCNKWGILDKIQAYCSYGMSRDTFDGIQTPDWRTEIQHSPQTVLGTRAHHSARNGLKRNQNLSHWQTTV